MNDPWELLQSTTRESLNTLWDDFAKEGNEGAVFAPLAKYPNSAAWLAQSLAMSKNSITRKLGAMLAGWIESPKHISLLTEMLDRERQVFREDRMNANSVGEDIMFAATRWTKSQNAEIRNSGIDILATMIRDALKDTPWNTVNWAVANLRSATDGKHEVFLDLVRATDSQLKGQQFLQIVVTALRQNDKERLDRLVTSPSELHTLTLSNPNYSMAKSLWDAAATTEATLR